MFEDLLTDNVSLIKRDGRIFNDIPASVQTKKIFIEASKIPAEEGDTVSRELPNGLIERYIILNTGYFGGHSDIPAHYQMEVKKETAIDPERQSSMQFNIGTVYGSTIGTQGDAHVENVFNFEKVDQLIEDRGGDDKEALRDMIEEIKEFFEDSEKVKKGSLSKFSELMEKHSWITGAVSQLGLGFLTGSLFK
ncbi:hypothetical protein [Paenibacillus sp. MER 99-2]|uniref:hypothetical protein n=1 Tax=Paenibacillus sp. MER 99-2 TaxID=2939572 RepID=UPI00203E899B|nr:hypothetical protein [Paenibacillus sp. MER 99-2]MCM3173245.1 hypothetical protein [Paenibacillus sp. MER 99-2]